MGEARLQPIVPDLFAFYEDPPMPVTVDKKPWALLFDPEACNEKYADKTLEEMELNQQKVMELA